MPRVKKLSDEAVLDLALQAMLEHGPQATTLPLLGRAVGLSPATLLQRFGSKGQLFERVFERAQAGLVDHLAARPQGPDPRADLLALLHRQAEPFVTRAHAAGHLALLVQDITDETRRLATQQYLHALRKGIARDLSRLGCPDPDPLAIRLEALWSGLMLQWAIQDEVASVHDWLDTHFGPVLDALLTWPPPDGAA